MEQSEQNPLQNPASSAPANAVPILKVMRLQAPELCQVWREIKTDDECASISYLRSHD